MSNQPTIAIRAVTPGGRTKVYSSHRAASRELDGRGRDNRRSWIVEQAINRGGGYIGRVWVSPAQ